MVIELAASRAFTWKGRRPDYVVVEEAETSEQSLKTKFADLPSAGIWADRTESDDELLEELGSGWRGFAT